MWSAACATWTSTLGEVIRKRKDTGEPDAAKAARPVRKGDDGKAFR